jgi:hypothetical protein
MMFMFSPTKISWVVSGIKCICLNLLPVFYLIQPFSKQIICFELQKQNSALPLVFSVPCPKACSIQYTSLCFCHIVKKTKVFFLNHFSILISSLLFSLEMPSKKKLTFDFTWGETYSSTTVCFTDLCKLNLLMMVRI